MANKKITLKDKTNTDELYPATLTSNVFDDKGNSLDALLSDLKLIAGTGIDITGNVISNKYVSLASPNLNNINYNYMGYVTTATNVPSGVSTSGQFMCVVRKEDSNYLKQFFMPYNTNDIYMRNNNGGTWSNWGKILSSVNQATNVNAFDDATTGDMVFGIVWGIFTNIAYLSFDTSWIRLQFKISSSSIQARLKYGGSNPTSWKDIYTK